jgi:pimeloyl-ACP methyl ester carboxylesterase
MLRRLALFTLPLALVTAPIGAVPAGAASASSPPRLTWSDCGQGFQCADATVPLDYAHPRGRTITIAMIKLPATDPAHRIGSLFTNPGGPGGSGTDFVRQAARSVYSPQVRARFDVIGFDPRFIGASRPAATCVSDAELNDLLGDVPAVPWTRALARRTYDAYAQFSARCAQRSPFLAYGSTANVARDMDLLRQAVGDRKLNYVGYSYGSILGQTYAALFPSRIRSLTIDGVIDAQQWSTGRPGEAFRVPFDSRLGNARSAYATLQQFLTRCDQAGPAKCAFAGNARARFERLTTYLKTHTVTVQGVPFDYSVLVSGVLSVLYDPLTWADNAAALQLIYDTAFPSASLGAARPAATADVRGLAEAARAPRLRVPGPRGPGSRMPGSRVAGLVEPPADQGLAATHSVACSDTISPRGLRPWVRAGERLDRRAPYFGRAWTWTWAACSSWKLPAPGRYLGPYDKRTSSPVLVFGNTYDPATPWSAARAVARTIPGARLLTVDGYGHTTLAAPSACAQAAFDAYLIDGRLPARGTVCSQDVAPFS